MTTTTRTAQLLEVYLNDHLAGATAGAGLARRLADSESGWAPGLGRIAGEIHEDRSALLELMRLLDVRLQRYKSAIAWVGEKAGRFKPNRHLFTRSPLSRVIELEMLRLGVEGKAAAWRTLREVAETEPRLPVARLEALDARARAQIEELEALRVRAVAEALAP
jgi:hypothetical protein